MIQGDNKIGHFAVKRDGTLFRSAERVSATPTSIVRRRYGNCRVGMAEFRPLDSVYYNLGGQDACEPQYGYFSQAIMTRQAGGGRRRVCASGIRGSTSSATSLVPAQRPAGPWWWLVTRRSPYGDNSLYAGLEAKVQRGWVVAFRVNYAAGGDERPNLAARMQLQGGDTIPLARIGRSASSKPGPAEIRITTRC